MAIDTSNTVKPGSTLTQRGSGTSNTANRSDAGNRATQSPERSSESVVLSSEAQSLNKLEAAIGSASEVNSDKVSAVKQAIAEGRFEINAERLAEAMLAQDDLLG
ncbi:flagellar biosynthesis anti-sigma factor FlgM [Gilvimarinus sp. DA14]|uniref:flagellar biosynthesis anti-sigma factor FlgM n=1 Tax=Gilvimarinus sp. DA14 TaxID=2956798 RepID=UPI0020B7BA9C|nr:flagellar biosynthesis anti-sigma factor FlgM [Gilvimarinus sp. DA14]UTF60822.1 flagellar biosynthesis anti-sigma factor FlgM [Gilvimarinus sp. DA14]